jgi:hypothetical protein
MEVEMVQYKRILLRIVSAALLMLILTACSPGLLEAIGGPDIVDDIDEAAQDFGEASDEIGEAIGDLIEEEEQDNPNFMDPTLLVEGNEGACCVNLAPIMMVGLALSFRSNSKRRMEQDE